MFWGAINFLLLGCLYFGVVCYRYGGFFWKRYAGITIFTTLASDGHVIFSLTIASGRRVQCLLGPYFTSFVASFFITIIGFGARALYLWLLLCVVHVVGVSINGEWGFGLYKDGPRQRDAYVFFSWRDGYSFVTAG